MSLPGERAIIARIREQAGLPGRGLVAGIGDDCAVYRESPGKLSLITMDTLVEGVHFDFSLHPPAKLGQKSVSVNVSDIAAMGGIPRFALLSLALRQGVSPEWLDNFMAGFLGQLQGFQVLLIGGDTVRSGHEIMISVTLIGEGAEGKVVYRSGARKGDRVLVSGSLGEAAGGLAVLRNNSPENQRRWPQLLEAHLNPLVRAELGHLLAETGRIHAMMDISDGLATDLAHICAESGVGAEISAGAVPINEALRSAAAYFSKDPLEWALQGGEDYQLLFTCAPEDEASVRDLAAEKCGCELFCVGRIIAGKGVHLVSGDGSRREISYQGYDHFS